MSNHTASWTYVGLDVHAETITVAVAEGSGRARGRHVGTIPNRPDAIRKAMKKLGEAKSLRVCYEAGPSGYALYWQLHKMGIACEVIAPTLVPVRAGELTAIFVPDAEHEALRDLVRAREAAKKDQLRARHRLGKFLLRLGRRRDTQSQAWGQVHWRWLDSLVSPSGSREVPNCAVLNVMSPGTRSGDGVYVGYAPGGTRPFEGDISGSAVVDMLQIYGMFEWRLSRVVALTLTTRWLPYVSQTVVRGEIVVDDETGATIGIQADILDNNAFAVIPGAVFSWNRANIRLGVGYGAFFVEPVGLVVPASVLNSISPEFDVFVRF